MSALGNVTIESDYQHLKTQVHFNSALLSQLVKTNKHVRCITGYDVWCQREKF